MVSNLSVHLMQKSPYDAGISYSDDKRHLIPAVTHVDGTGRLQTVNEDHNGRYFRLISRFRRSYGCSYVATPLLMRMNQLFQLPAG